MRTKRVIVVPYDEKWRSAFEQIKNEIEAVVGDMCYEQIEFECEEPSYIRFTVVDAYDNTNYLKLKKTKNRIYTTQNVVGIGA